MRPSSDRVRESLFARLGALEGVSVLDLFAGTGSLGIEALSRGAARTVFVERAGPSIACLQKNLESLGLGESARVLRSDVLGAVRRLERAGERFSLVLMDPPYGATAAGQVLLELSQSEILRPAGVLVVEASRRHPPGSIEGLALVDERTYGDTLVVRYEAPANGASGDPDQGGNDAT